MNSRFLYGWFWFLQDSENCFNLFSWRYLEYIIFPFLACSAVVDGIACQSHHSSLKFVSPKSGVLDLFGFHVSFGVTEVVSDVVWYFM